MSRYTPLEKTLERATSLADTASSLLDSASLDGLANERNPETEVLY
jgi:hypothetical protein